MGLIPMDAALDDVHMMIGLTDTVGLPSGNSIWRGQPLEHDDQNFVNGLVSALLTAGTFGLATVCLYRIVALVDNSCELC